MRRARLTFQGAFHHCVNRGLNRERILSGDASKKIFLNLLAETSAKMKIRVLAYCLMDNHYHLVIQNSSGRMADFFKLLNGEYGTDYRRRCGGNGYVFQGRFKSTVIQDDRYLMMAISYVLGNPVRAKVVGDYLEYPWSSSGAYFHRQALAWLDSEMVEELYGGLAPMREHVRLWQEKGEELPIIHTELGPVMASEEGAGKLQERFERRGGKDSLERKRKNDFGFEPVEKIYKEFSIENKIDVDSYDFSSREGRILRRELLVALKDRGGLKYHEIARLPEFSGVKMNALGSLYRHEKSKK